LHSYDGDGANRSFWRRHFAKDAPVEHCFAVPDPNVSGKSLFFTPDAKHVLKRFRNSLAHSFSPKSTRCIVLPFALIDRSTFDACAVALCASKPATPAFGRVRWSLLQQAHANVGSAVLHSAGGLASADVLGAPFDSWRVMSVPLALAICTAETRSALFAIIVAINTRADAPLDARQRLLLAADLAATLTYIKRMAEFAELAGVYDSRNSNTLSAASISAPQPRASSKPAQPTEYERRCNDLLRWLLTWRDTDLRLVLAGYAEHFLSAALERQRADEEEALSKLVASISNLTVRRAVFAVFGAVGFPVS
jgi:hypothetical protein